MTFVVDKATQDTPDALLRYVHAQSTLKRSSGKPILVDEVHAGKVTVLDQFGAKPTATYQISAGTHIWMVDGSSFCVDLPGERVQLTFTRSGGAWSARRRQTDPPLPRRIPSEPLSRW